MAKFRSILEKIGRTVGGILGGKPKIRRKEIWGGHRGIAAGDWKERERRFARGETVFTAAETAAWKILQPHEATAFVYDGLLLFVHSTNVAACQYFIKDRKLMVEYLNGRAYLYDNVTEDEAIELVRELSKGKWVWDRLRIRGTKTGHRKPYRRIS